MKLSWSHKLFLKINAMIGKNSVRDRFMSFCGYWLLFIFVFSIVLYGLYQWRNGNSLWFVRYIELFATAFIFAEAFSYSFAFFFRHPRPIVEFPSITQLRIPLETWKSFPSDHAIASFSLAGVLILLPGTVLWFVLFSYACALLISSARVYIGVHYPRDIIGGAIVGTVVVWLSPILFFYIIEPIARLW